MVKLIKNILLGVIKNMSDVIYLKFDQEIKISEYKINIGMLGTVICSNKNIQARVRAIRVTTLKKYEAQKQVFSIMKIIELINNEFPECDINNIGESEFIIDYNKDNIDDKNNAKIIDIIKVVFTGLFVFMGAGYSIIAYNNDVGVNEIFQSIYELFTGEKSNGMTTLELGYCIGLFVGIITFYNHIFKRKFSDDPTPLDVELKSYKEEINKAIINDADEKGEVKDAD